MKIMSLSIMKFDSISSHNSLLFSMSSSSRFSRENVKPFEAVKVMFLFSEKDDQECR